MKKPAKFATFACTATLALTLAACGGSGASDNSSTSGSSTTGSAENSETVANDEARTPTYTPSKLTLDNFDLEIVSASLEYDELEGMDALVFVVKATNNGSEASALGGALNIGDETQGGETLYWAYDIVGTDAGSNAYAADGSLQPLEPGASAEYTYAFLLENYDDPVIVNFQGYGSSTQGGGEVTFEIAGCQSAESKAAQQSAADAAASRADEVANGEKSATIPGAKIELADGWFFPYISDYAVTAQNADENQIFILTDSKQTDAAGWSEDMGSKFSSHSVEDREFNGTPVKYIEISETAWYAFLDTTEGPIEIDSSGVTYDDAQAALKQMTLS